MGVDRGRYVIGSRSQYLFHSVQFAEGELLATILLQKVDEICDRAFLTIRQHVDSPSTRGIKFWLLFWSKVEQQLLRNPPFAKSLDHRIFARLPEILLSGL